MDFCGALGTSPPHTGANPPPEGNFYEDGYSTASSGIYAGRHQTSPPRSYRISVVSVEVVPDTEDSGGITPTVQGGVQNESEEISEMLETSTQGHASAGTPQVPGDAAADAGLQGRDLAPPAWPAGRSTTAAAGDATAPESLERPLEGTTATAEPPRTNPYPSFFQPKPPLQVHLPPHSV